MFGKQNNGNSQGRSAGHVEGWAAKGQPFQNQNNQNGQNNQNQQNGQSQNGQNNQQNQNNNGTDDQDVLNIWDEPKVVEKTGDNQNNQQPGNNQQQQQGTQQTPEQMLAAHMQEMGLAPVQISDAEKQAFADTGDFAPIMAKVNDQMQKTYLASMRNMNTVMQNTVKEAVKEAVSQTSNTMEIDKFRGQMHKALPFTSDPLISPIAEGIAKRAFMHGKTNDEAIAIVKKQFSHLYEKSGEFVAPNGNVGGNFSQKTGEGVPDWFEFLVAKPGA